MLLVTQWLLEDHDLPAVSEQWVPGATSTELRHLANLGALLASVIRGTEDLQTAAFSAGHVRDWLSPTLAVPDAVIDAARTILGETGEQGLASLYARLVSAQSRRTLGTFFTPRSEVDWMVSEWNAAHHAPAAVVDVGAGVGAFTTAAAAAWPEAAIWAVDINPVTLGLLALRVVREFRVKEGDNTAPGVRVVLGDFTRWMASTWPNLKGPRLILGNPPYTRLQLLPETERERLHLVGGGLCGRRASLSTLIAAQSLLALGEEDGLSLLLPAQWLEAKYAADFRNKLWSLGNRKVTMRLFEDGLFDDARVDAVALTVGPAQEALQPVEFWIAGPTATFRTTMRSGQSPVEFRSFFSRRPSRRASMGILLSDLLDVRRGTASGANSFFALTAQSAARHSIPDYALRALVRRLFSIPDEITSSWLSELPNSQRHVLLSADAGMLDRSSELRDYVKHGVDQKFHERHLCRTRRTWFDLTAEMHIPDVIIGQSTRHAFRLVKNSAQAGILNNLYGMTWRPEVGEDSRDLILDWLRSERGQGGLRAAARVHGSRLLKIEPGALKEVRVPTSLMAG